MPIFQYECLECENIEEVWIHGNEENVVCSKCGGELKKLISASTFILKGGGWFSDGYDKGKKGE